MNKHMYNIAIMDKELSMLKVSDAHNSHIIYFTEEKHFFHQLNSIQGVILYQKNEEDLNNNWQLILSIKKRKPLPIWIIDETKNSINRRLLIELGVVGVLGRKYLEEGLFVLVENTLELICLKNSKLVQEKEEKETFELNPRNLSLQVSDNLEVRFTYLEYRVIAFLMTRTNQAFTYAEIHAHLDEDEIEREVKLTDKKYRIANIIFQIRNKLQRYELNPKMLRTVRSVGYMLDTRETEVLLIGGD